MVFRLACGAARMRRRQVVRGESGAGPIDFELMEIDVAHLRGRDMRPDRSRKITPGEGLVLKQCVGVVLYAGTPGDDKTEHSGDDE